MKRKIMPKIFKILASGTLAFAYFTASAAGGWKFEKYVDRMTDQKRCFIGYTGANAPVIYDSNDALLIVYKKLGGVKAYRYRIDKQPVREFMSPLADITNTVYINVSHGELKDASVLRVDGLTLLGDTIDVTLDLTGLQKQRERMAMECGISMPEPQPQRPSGDWPAVPKLN